MVSTSSRLQGEIIKLIKQRHFESGERLFSEREFAEKFDTTRAAIREAITALEALRVVERRPQSGIYLRDMNSDSSIDMLVLEAQNGHSLQIADIDEAIELRRMLEIEAIRLAAARRDEHDIETISGIIEDAQSKLDKGESIEVEDELFHKAIAKSTKNSLLLRVVNSYYEMSKERRVRYFSNIESSRISHAQHKRLFNAFKRGDSDRCVDLMKDHLSQTSRIWASLLEEEDQG
jgi:GntR family transcriptional repressor for pyruvate dehydrogenase complex